MAPRETSDKTKRRDRRGQDRTRSVDSKAARPNRKHVEKVRADQRSEGGAARRTDKVPPKLGGSCCGNKEAVDHNYPEPDESKRSKVPPRMGGSCCGG